MTRPIFTGASLTVNNPATKETQYNQFKILLNHPSDHESSIKHKYFMQLHSPGNSADRQNDKKNK